jgi:hypothetical protein
MPNSCGVDKCVSAAQQCASYHGSTSRPHRALAGDAAVGAFTYLLVDCAHFALSAAAFLHPDMNFLRSLPWTPLASASFEHSSEAAVRGFSAFFAAGAVFVAGGEAGVVVCANAELIKNSEAKAVAAMREERFVMGSPQVEKSTKVTQ